MLIGILIRFQEFCLVGIELFLLDIRTGGYTALFALQKSLKVTHCVAFHILVLCILHRVQ